MNRNFIFKLFSYILLVLAPVLWLLKILMPTTVAWYNLSFAVGCLSAGIALLILLQALLITDISINKKIKIFIAGGLGIVSLFCFVSAFALPKNIIAPIVCIIISSCLLFGLLATGGKSWDQADNHKMGYKNYHQRKAEEEKKEQNQDN